MEHLEWHKHAFIDADNRIIAIPVFDESAHGTQLLEDVKEQLGAVAYICCCDNGETDVGAYWINGRFTSIKHSASDTLNTETYEWEPLVVQDASEK